MTRSLLLIRHHEKPDDDRVQIFAERNGFTPVSCRPYLGEALPELCPDVAGVVVFGGRQSAADFDSDPYLADEMAFITKVMAADLPLLGICLGAQLIVRALGGRVGPLNGDLHEFGYYPVAPTAEGRDFLPDTLHVTQAHYHTFTLPEGVTHLAKGDNYANQAFRYGHKVYGVQFHPECTADIFRRWQQSEHAAYGQPGAQSREEQDRLMASHDAAQGAWFNGFLEKLFKDTAAGQHGRLDLTKTA
jgi:GMP synthase (glutamine-hydrolysing)